MRQVQIIPFSLLFGLLVSLALLLGVNRGSVAVAAHPRTEPALLRAQTGLTTTQTISSTRLTPVQAQPVVPVTATTGVAVTGVLPIVTPTPASQLPIVELKPDEVLTGTIIHNNSTTAAFFFLDVDLYELPPNRAVGLKLTRPLTALTLYTCAADVIEDPTCDWISYPIRRSAFYEINADLAVPGQANLGLALAAAPPLGTTRIQNRTGADRTLLLGDLPLEIANTRAIQIEEAEGAGGTLYLPRCLQTNTQRICEWLPTDYQGGVYYALTEDTAPAGIGGVTVLQSGLDALLIQEALMTPTPTPEPAPVGILCQTQIPSLNVRSGPGTNFLVINKLRIAEENQGRVLAVGRTESGEWLVVDPRFASGGWVANVPQWIVCDGDTDELPVVAVADEQAIRVTPIPVRALEPTPTATPVPEESTETAPEIAPETDPETVPGASGEEAEGLPGPEQALLIVTNSFDHAIRFTLDAPLHGLPEGTPSEYDLEPGQSLRFLIRAGRVQFSASTAWRDGSGNAEFVLGERASRELFLRFAPLESDPNRWVLRFE